jgi:uncharacterized protein YbjT (DUF2867 family)
MNPGGVFVTGASGYIGSRLVPVLLARGHRVTALVRPGREGAFADVCRVVTGNALDACSFRETIGDDKTLGHLVGVSHPSPAKAAAFRDVDLASLRAALAAAVYAGVRHFIYLSVAQPAPVMRDYMAARSEGENLLRASGLAATILRPWYGLGPDHCWPLLLLPLYYLAEALPATRAGAQRLGLVTIEQLLGELVESVESPASGWRVFDVLAIR